MAVSVGVVGSGLIAQFHLNAFAQMDVKVAMIAEPDMKRAEPWLASTGAAWTASWEDLVSDPGVQMVGIFTPTWLHYPVAKAALENGKHVVCEKTLTLSPEESLELGRLAEAKGLCFYTSYMKRYFPAVQKAKELIPKLGHLMSVYCRTYQGGGTYDPYTEGASGWMKPDASGKSAIKKATGGGVLICGGSHIVDLLLHLVGKPTRIYGRTVFPAGGDVDINHHALVDLECGAFAHMEFNWHPLHKIGFEGKGWDEGFEISGTKGRLVLETPKWDQPTKNPAKLSYYDNEAGTWMEFLCDIVCPFAEAEKHFVAQIEKGEQGPQDRYTGYRADLVLEMCRVSAERNEPVEVRFEA